MKKEEHENYAKYAYLVMLLFAIAWVLIAMYAVSGCTTATPLERGPLKELVLRPRKGHQDKLTNQRCSEYKKHTNECTKFDLREYDFNDDSTRAFLRDLKFICKVRGERFVPCEKSRGLCQLRKNISGWGPWKKSDVVVNKYLSLHDDYDFLIAANAYCASFYSDAGQDMWR